MRIRTIKPEFWQNEKLSSVSPDAALLAIGLLNYADDEGFFNANPALIKAAIFPIRQTADINTMLIPELERIDYVQFFNDKENRNWGVVKNFRLHQVINKPKPSKIRKMLQLPDEYRSNTEQVPVGREGKGTGTGKGTEPEEFKNKENPFFSNFKDFFAMYPIKINEQEARDAFYTVPEDTTITEIMDGLKHYIKNKPDAQEWLHPANWIKQARWKDRYTKPGEAAEATQEEKDHQQELFNQLKEKAASGDLPAKIKADFINQYGMASYNSWLAGCAISQDDTGLVITADSRFIKDWLASNYGDFLKKYAVALGVGISFQSKAELPTKQKVA